MVSQKRDVVTDCCISYYKSWLAELADNQDGEKYNELHAALLNWILKEEIAIL